MAAVEKGEGREPRRLRFRGLKTLGFVGLLYLLLFITGNPHATEAVRYTFEVLAEILPILALILVLMAAIGQWVDPKGLTRHLGEEGGWKGWLVALGAGILSHGPMYAWYPMLEELKKHGLRDGYIAAFFYARAVKLPLLPIMIHYFGWGFTALLSLYTVLGAWLQGLIVDWIEKRRE
ncbi:permease [Nitratifractor sp.]